MSDISGLVPKTTGRSPVWQYFGFQPDEFGLPVDKEKPVCRVCRQKVSSREGSTSNMFQHLKVHHPDEYDKCVVPEKRVKTEVANTNTDSEVDDESVVIVMKKGAKSAVWQYYGYRVDELGKLQERDLPTCVLCKRDIASKGGSTGNMRQHLRTHHPREYEKVLEAKPGKNNLIHFDKLPNVRQDSGNHYSTEVSSGVQSVQMYEQIKNQTSSKVTVWEYFGYPHLDEEYELDANKPCCLLCKEQVKTKKGDDSSLFDHLKQRHNKRYEILMSRIDPVFLDTLPMKKTSESPVWMFFSYETTEQGDSQNKTGIAKCLLCKEIMSTSGGDISDLLHHLKENHHQEYEICSEVLNEDKTADGDPMPDSPVSSTHTRLTDNNSHYKEDNILPKMNDDNLLPKMNDNNLLPKMNEDNLLPKMNGKSPAWDYFGFKANVPMHGPTQVPTCRLCKEDVKACGNTSNILGHLKRYHPEAFNGCLLQVQTGKYLQMAAECIKSGNENTPDYDPNLDVSTLLPKEKAVSPVWEYFGFLPDPQFAEEPLDTGIPTCRLCKKNVVSRDTTSNLASHLKRHHPEEFQNCLRKGPKKSQQTTQFPNDGQKSTNNSDPANESSTPFNCHLCEKALSDEEVINHIEKTDKCFDDECSELKFCWDCFVIQHCTEVSGDEKPNKELDTIVFQSCAADDQLMESDTEKEDGSSNQSIKMETADTDDDTNEDDASEEDGGEEEKESDDGIGNGDDSDEDYQPSVSSKDQSDDDIDDVDEPDFVRGVTNSKKDAVIKGGLILVDQQMSTKLVLMFFAYPKVKKDNKSEPDPVCLLCKTPCPVEKEDDSSSLLHHLEKKHPMEHAMCKEMSPGSCNPRFLMRKSKSVAWLFFGYYADQYGMPKDINVPVCLLCKKSYLCRGGSTASLIQHLERYHCEEFSLFRDSQSGIFTKEYVHCWNPTIRSSEPVHLPASKTDSVADFDAGSTPSISQPSTAQQQPEPKVPFVCHRCKKPLAENETINNDRAGAPTPDGEIDYDYCWDCFAVLHDIGYKEDHNAAMDDGNKRYKESADLDTMETEADDANQNGKYTFDTYERNTRHGVYKNGLYFCKICQKSYHKRQSLQKHSKLHELKEKYLCSICSKEFMWEASLHEHERRHLGVLNLSCGVRPFECRMCTEQFVSNYRRKKHERAEHGSQVGVLNLSCGDCGKTFPNKYKLQRHERIHTGEKPFTCEYCGKTFGDKYSFMHHTRRHTGEKPFQCRMCTEQFVSNYRRKNHERDEHGSL